MQRNKVIDAEVRRRFRGLIQDLVTIELPAIVSECRESMAMSSKICNLPAQHALKKPLSKVIAKLSRPFYLFDQRPIETHAYELDGTLQFVHRLLHQKESEDVPEDAPAAIVIESY